MGSLDKLQNIDKVTNFGRKVGEFTMVCPFCGGPLNVTEAEYEIPMLGKVLIISKKCSKCGYKRNDIIPLEYRRHTRLYMKVEAPEDFRVKVVRSPTTRILIPELGLEVEPGIDAEMFVTNIEGLLYLFLDALKRLKVLDKEVDTSSAERVLEEIIEQQKGGFTVILEDVNGLSLFLPEGKNILVITEEVE
ncbi:MAG: ZPR1 zinc finger domain-containing protein [Infirmifilum sp.]|jgi:zinc finger protein|uniref:ZPR1 zinc finger domain-containing protein n=1 Tax=Infirmifilum TaxID=2856573 RepID=UPI00069ADBFA|nr:ZPR1 zinc finger domain-containing protein [Infirmifilum uzonense]